MPLNESLYKVLDHNIGVVGLADEGCELVGEYHRDRDGRMVMYVISPGEYIRVSCPFCNDTRGRLWINHRWGVRDPITGSLNLFLARCFNEDCLSHPARLQQLRFLTTQYIRSARAGRVTVKPGTKVDPTKPIALPQDCKPLAKLPADHPAIRYLLARGFDPEEVAERWGVCYSRGVCSWSPAGRLVIPFYGPLKDKPLVGWQARAITKDDDGPKYYTAPGCKKSHILYGLHRVRKDGPVAICEGPTDVWRLGRNAVALLGKKPSSEQLRLVREHLYGRPLVVMLDPDAAKEAGDLVARLTAIRRGSLLHPDESPVLSVALAAGYDPADYSRKQLWRLIEQAGIPNVGR